MHQPRKGPLGPFLITCIAGDECLLRRVITADGRSRAYINGSVSTLQDCSELGALLIDIHSQHAHQSLLRKEVQRQLLDTYAKNGPTAAKLEQTASDWLRATLRTTSPRLA